MERTWIIQKVEAADARLRFYSPRIWILLTALVVILFCGAWAEGVRRDAAPAWTLVPVFLLFAFIVAATIGQYRSSPEGLLHFQVDRSGISFGGQAFRPVVFAPYSALKRILVGDRYLGLIAPVLFEFHPSAIREHGLGPFQLHNPALPVVLCSYRGLSREAFEAELGRLLGEPVPVVRFGSVDRPAQLGFEVDGALSAS